MNQPACHYTGPGEPRLLLDRHDRDCVDNTCPGCIPCQADHCWDDGETHLDDQHPVTCPRCIGRHRELLETLRDAEPDLRERMVRNDNDGIPGSNHILGGNALVLLGEGSEGAYWTTDRTERIVPAYTCGACWTTGILDPARHLLEAHLSTSWLAEAPMFTLDAPVVVEPQGNDNHTTDPPSVLFELARVEDDWRSKLGHPPGLRATITASVDYLTRNLTWAAQRWDGYPDFIEEMRTLRTRVVAELGDSNPTINGVPCLVPDCEGILQRRYWPPDPCDHDPRPDEVHVCDQGGRRDDWVCSRCSEQVDSDRYKLAVAQLHLDQKPLRTAGQLQQMYGINPATIRQWAARGHIGRHDNPDRPGHWLYDAREVRKHAQAGGLLAG